jgi:hypothetical protein
LNAAGLGQQASQLRLAGKTSHALLVQRAVSQGGGTEVWAALETMVTLEDRLMVRSSWRVGFGYSCSRSALISLNTLIGLLHKKNVFVKHKFQEVSAYI